MTDPKKDLKIELFRRFYNASKNGNDMLTKYLKEYDANDASMTNFYYNNAMEKLRKAKLLFEIIDHAGLKDKYLVWEQEHEKIKSN